MKDGHALVCNYYCLQVDGSGNYPRNWILEGSHDNQTWVLLRQHNNDESLFHSGQVSGWPVFGKNASTAFRYFRVKTSGPNSTSYSGLFLCGLELYGYYM
jgi:hypothetical protein